MALLGSISHDLQRANIDPSVTVISAFSDTVRWNFKKSREDAFGAETVTERLGRSVVQTEGVVSLGEILEPYYLASRLILGG